MNTKRNRGFDSLMLLSAPFRPAKKLASHASTSGIRSKGLQKLTEIQFCGRKCYSIASSSGLSSKDIMSVFLELSHNGFVSLIIGEEFGLKPWYHIDKLFMTRRDGSEEGTFTLPPRRAVTKRNFRKEKSV